MEATVRVDGASKQRLFDLGLGEIRSSLAANPLRGGEPSISRMRTCVFKVRKVAGRAKADGD